MTLDRFDVRARCRRALVAVFLVAGLPSAGSAGDGIVEINQASALAGGGFPVTIAAPGSYALTSNLTLLNTADAINVTADDVYLDLNGFAIVGPAVCAGSPPPVGAGSGVVSSALATTVVNGSVRGFGSSGIMLADEGRVAEVRVRCAGAVGIRVGGEGRIERSAVSQSAVGIETGATALLVDNAITSNSSVAMILGAGAGIRGNVLAGNNGGNSNSQIQAAGSFFELGPNRCGNGLTCTAGGLCGNGQIDGGESCDDANANGGDGCSSLCQVEAGYQCTGVPSACTPNSACQDGVVNNGESCDDGNFIDGDGCDNNCTATGCGNGITTGAEACDDGNSIDGDGCDSNCTNTGCGNGIRSGIESCDGSDLGGQSCLSVGYSSGSLACSISCTFDVSFCVP